MALQIITDYLSDPLSNLLLKCYDFKSINDIIDDSVSSNKLKRKSDWEDALEVIIVNIKIIVYWMFTYCLFFNQIKLRLKKRHLHSIAF